MSYTRDHDHYTRGVGAVQAADRTLAGHRGRALMKRDAMNESARRDRLRQRLLRPALGAVNLTTSKASGFNRAPLVVGGSVEGGGGLNSGGVLPGGSRVQSGMTMTGGGGVSPTNVRAKTFSILTALQSAFTPTPMNPPTPGRPWLPTDQVCGPGTSGVYPDCIPDAGTTTGGTASTSGGSSSTSSSTSTAPINPVTGSSPTSQVGTRIAGGGGGGGSPTSAPSSGDPLLAPVDTDTQLDLTPPAAAAPAYKKYAMYGGAALAALLLYRQFAKKGRR